jgi:AcrR family transcriptional regulator
MVTRNESKQSRSRKKVGRRSGPHSARGAVLAAARLRFANDGYEATTIRAVARDARVDPSLVMQFYGSKEGLFSAVVEQRADPEIVLGSLAGPRAGRGRRFTRAYFSLWEDPVGGDQLRSIVRAAIGSPRATAVLQGLHVAKLAQSGIPASGHLGIVLAAAHLLGVAVARYILELPALVELPLEKLIQRLSPVIDKYLRAGD